MVLKNTIWLAIEKFSKAIYTFSTIIILARFFDESTFGNFSFSRSILGIITTFSYMGMSGIIVSKILERNEDTGKIIGSALTYKAIMSVSAFLISFAWGMTSLDTNLERSIYALTTLPVIFFSLDVFEFYFQSKQDSGKIAKSRVVTNLLSLAGIFTCIYLRLDIFYPLIILIADTSIYSLLLFYNFSKEKIKLSFNLSEVKELAKDSLPLFISGLLAMSNLKIDQIMIKHILNAKEVAKYAVCSNLIDPLSLFGMVFMSGIFPYLHKKYALHGETQEFYNANKIVSFIGISFIIFSFFFSEPLINTIYGEKYITSANIFKAHSFSLIFLLWGQVYFKWVLIKKCYNFTLFSHGIGALINIILNIYFLEIYGVIGASYSTIISYFFSFSLALLFSKNTRQLLVYQIKSIVSCLNIIGSYRWIKSLK